MASKLVVDAVATRLAGGFSRCPVIEENTGPMAPADGTAFLVVQYPVANEEHISLGPVGQRLFRESGGFRLVLAMPSGAGLSTGLQWADELRTLFRAAQFGGVSCLGASPATINDGNDDANYYRLSVVVEYYFDLQA